MCHLRLHFPPYQGVHETGSSPVRRVVLRRSVDASLEAAEVIRRSGAGKILSIRASFDEYNLDIELLHSGHPLQLDSATLSPAELDALMTIPGDGRDLEVTMTRVSALVLEHLADRVLSQRVREKSATGCLRLHFDH
jgi:xanthine permease XanP